MEPPELPNSQPPPDSHPRVKKSRPAPDEMAPKVDLPTKRRRKLDKKPQRPRRDNRKSRFDPDFTGDDERHNANLEHYYRAQKIVPDDEFPLLLKTLAIPLPSSFRISAAGAFRDSILNKLNGDMTHLFQRVAASAQSSGDDPLKPLAAIPWYPEGLAWTVSAPRQMLRRDNVLAPFHRFLVAMNDIGAINRQEAVSMIPPLMLDVHEGHSVLDMCAAPGSKTAQIVESVSSHAKPLSAPGVIIANDADLKRCWMLVHQLKRFGSAELLITHHEAQHFPKFMTFDRVLCDVPCSGDGTLRKAPDIWRRWNSDMGVALHRLQRQIVERGVDILKPGGKLVYSTCSMNPLENEAVVAHVIRKYGDDVELLDCSDKLPKLIRRPGLSTWLVKDNSNKEKRGAPQKQEPQVASGKSGDPKKESQVVSNENGDTEKLVVDKAPEVCNDVQEQEVHDSDAPGNTISADQDGTRKTPGWFTSFEQVPERRRVRIVQSMFPPSEEELKSGRFKMERCMRLVPHDQDTGAFFVAVFRKKDSARMSRRQRREEAEGLGNGNRDAKACHPDETAAVESKPKEENIQKEENISNKKALEVQGASKRERRATRLIMDDALVDVKSISPETLDNIVDYFGLDQHIGDHYLMTRGGDGKTFKKVVALSRTARTVVRHAVGSQDESVGPERRVVRVVNAGIRIFERTDRKDTTCAFRLVHDGMAIMRRMMHKRVMDVDVDKEEVKRLIKEKTVKVDAEGHTGKEFWESVLKMGSGSGILVCEGEEVVVWIGKIAVSLVMPNEVIDALRMRFVEKAC